MLAAISLAAACPLAAAPQDIPQPLTAASPGIGSPSAPILGHFDSFTDTQDDVIQGQPGAAKYNLSWTGILVESEVVVRADRIQQPGADYVLDAAAGTIQFMPALAAGELARVSYRCGGPGSTRRASAPAVPVKLDMFHIGEDHVTLVSMLTDNAAAQPVSSPGLEVGGANRLFHGSTLSSDLYVDLHGGSWMRRGALQLEDQTVSRFGSIGLKFSRAGSLFHQSGASAITPGQEVLAVHGVLTPMRAITLSLMSGETASLVGPAADSSAPDTVGARTHELSGELSVNLPAGAQLSASHIQQTQSSSQGPPSTSIRDSLSASGKIGIVSADLKLSASRAGSQATTGGATESEAIDLIAGQGGTLAIHATDTTAATGGAESVQQSVSVDSAPLARMRELKLHASLNQIADAHGVQLQREATVQLPSFKPIGLNVSGGVQSTSSASGDLLSGTVQASARPIKQLSLSGGAQLNQTVCAASGPDGYHVDLTVAPIRALQITGGFAQQAATSFGPLALAHQSTVSVKTTVGSVSLAGTLGYLDNPVASADSDTENVSLSVRLSRWDTLTTGLTAQNLVSNLLTGASTYTIGFTHTLGSIFDLNLSGSVTQRASSSLSAGGALDYQAQLGLGLHF